MFFEPSIRVNQNGSCKLHVPHVPHVPYVPHAVVPGRFALCKFGDGRFTRPQVLLPTLPSWN
jgi:hypothetical protein